MLLLPLLFITLYEIDSFFPDSTCNIREGLSFYGLIFFVKINMRNFLVKEVKNIMPNIIGLVNQLEGKPKELTKLGDAIRSDLDKLKSKVAMARDLASKLVCRAMLDHLLPCWRVSYDIVFLLLLLFLSIQCIVYTI